MTEPTSHWRRKDWLFYDLPSSPTNQQFSGGTIARELASLLLDDYDDNDIPGPVRWAATRRWLSPRPLQYYHVSKARARRVVRQLGRPGVDTSRLVGDFIAHEVAMSRRIWPDIEASQVILGFNTDIASSVLFTYDINTRVYLAVLTATCVDGDVMLFGQRLRVGDDACLKGNQVESRLPIPSCNLRSAREVRLWGQPLRLPAAKMIFNDGLTAVSVLEERGFHG